MNNIPDFEDYFIKKQNIKFIMINDIYKSLEDNETSKNNTQTKIIINEKYNKLIIVTEQIKKLLHSSSFNQGINIVLFLLYEYFFNRKPIKYDSKEKLINKIIEISKNINTINEWINTLRDKESNTLFFVPLLYELEKSPSKEYIDKIINYSNCIQTNHPFANWNVNYGISINKDKNL